MRLSGLLRGATRWLLPLIVVLAVVSPLGLETATAQDTNASSLEQQLADRYVPIAYLRRQAHECAGPPEGGEPYLPLPIEIVLDNADVLLRDGANDDRVLMSAPGALDLMSFGPETYLDYPGDPRRPGCTYEAHQRARIEELGLEPTTYAHIVFDAAEQRLALQYWFFYYFNHWNNTHESDWEMIQLMWDDVSGIEQALQQEPSRVGYSQHGNGELADWGDEKVQLEEGTHPLVFPAAGSHATFYSSDTFLAWGERASGFGCDISSRPSVRTPLKAVVVPDRPEADGAFSWLLYEGRWGERQRASFNGVVGPAFNGRWIDPWAASDNWRNFSIVVPEVSNTLGPTMTDAFCGLTEAGSRLLIFAMVQPWVAILLVAAVGGVLLFFYWQSRNLTRRARRLYLTHWRVFLTIGLLAIPIGIVFNVAQRFLIHREPLKFVTS